MINRLWRSFLIIPFTPFVGLCQTHSKYPKDFLIGQWKLIKKAKNNQESITLPHGPQISILIIEHCIDKRELSEFHPVVKEQRKINLFHNIRMIEIGQDGAINDTVYPTADIYSDVHISISSYGKRYKKYYSIKQISKDSIYFSNGDLYIKNTHPYSEMYFSSKSDPDIQMMNKILADKKKKPTRRRKKSN